jgi:hypothetical protein
VCGVVGERRTDDPREAGGRKWRSGRCGGRSRRDLGGEKGGMGRWRWVGADGASSRESGGRGGRREPPWSGATEEKGMSGEFGGRADRMGCVSVVGVV